MLATDASTAVAGFLRNNREGGKLFVTRIEHDNDTARWWSTTSYPCDRPRVQYESENQEVPDPVEDRAVEIGEDSITYWGLWHDSANPGPLDQPKRARVTITAVAPLTDSRGNDLDSGPDVGEQFPSGDWMLGHYWDIDSEGTSGSCALLTKDDLDAISSSNPDVLIKTTYTVEVLTNGGQFDFSDLHTWYTSPYAPDDVIWDRIKD